MRYITKKKVENRKQNTLKVMKCGKLIKKLQNAKDVGINHKEKLFSKENEKKNSPALF